MKNPVRSLIAIAALASVAFVSQAQETPKIVVVDMAKIYANHYKTEEQTAKLRGDEQKAQEELDKMMAAGNKLVEEYKELSDQVNNPTLTADAKQKAQAAVQAKGEEIQKLQQDVQGFKINTQRSLQQRLGTFQQIMVEEISKLATDIAKKHGANLVLNVASGVIYAAPSLDITDEVMAEINKNRPATPAAAPAAAPAAPAPAPATQPSAGPTITVPGQK